METVKFEVSQFSSGEYSVKIKDRIYGDAVIHWNWFDKNERDLMLLLSKIGAVKKQYGTIPITIEAPYLPYGRQDRVFEAGQDIAIETLVKAITGRYDDVTIETMGLHCKNTFGNKVINYLHKLGWSSEFVKVYPDQNAKKHFSDGDFNYLCFQKTRDLFTGSITKLAMHRSEITELEPNNIINNKFVICDDICAGGRTFTECAKKLREIYGEDIRVELLIYHAFLDHGIEELNNAGISKIHIINPDSYKYITKIYCNDLDYFNYKELA